MNGQENTGYDDDNMTAYLKNTDALSVQTEDDIDMNVMLADHHQKVLYQNLYKNDYWLKILFKIYLRMPKK